MTSTPRPAHLSNGVHRVSSAAINGFARRATSMTRDASSLGTAVPTDDDEREDDPTHQLLRAKWEETDALLSSLLSADGQLQSATAGRTSATSEVQEDAQPGVVKSAAPVKKAARHIDEDDYGDDDDDEEEEDGASDDLDKQSPLKSKGRPALTNGIASPLLKAPTSAPHQTLKRTNTTTSSEPAKTSEEARKQLEEGRKLAADNAKRSFQSAFYTFEYDKDAMLEQQRLDDLDREVENEISGDNQNSNAQANGATAGTTQGTLGSADLGASSLTLKHLIARIDQKRDMVRASDNQLRTLISEVRKGRSKWASEDRVGQEELYEAAEKVLMELKAMTDYVQPFLARVSKREAPDYFTVIRNPMDIGTMLKRLKQFHYKSKAEFVADLNLIWSNCLKYNSNPDHPFRKKAYYMRKETDKLTPLIPEVVVKDRAEVEAEERRNQAGDADDSDDDDAPIMASRGRKAPKKGGKGGPTSAARKAPSVEVDDTTTTPAPETKPAARPSSRKPKKSSSKSSAKSPPTNCSLPSSKAPTPSAPA